jgi:hypothetical protein
MFRIFLQKSCDQIKFRHVTVFLFKVDDSFVGSHPKPVSSQRPASTFVNIMSATQALQIEVILATVFSHLTDDSYTLCKARLVNRIWAAEAPPYL